MKRVLAATIIATLAICLTSSFGDDPAARERVVPDRPKTIAIEAPVKKLLAGSNATLPVAKPNHDFPITKARIESPTKKVVTNALMAKGSIESPTKSVIAHATTQPTNGANKPTKNPKVAPGTVNWHNNFAAACDAAKRSGKPVLLFQLMGNLDDQFC
jgi:hypothetical protein